MLNRLRQKRPGTPLRRLLMYDVIRRLAHALFVLFYRIRVYGHRRIPASGPLLLVCNHQSNLDPPAVSSSISSRHLEFLAKEGLFTGSGFLAWLIGNLNSLPIREDGGDAAAIKEILRRLGEGRAVLIFPEGTRSEDGAMHEFKRGVALLVKRGRCPVQPVAVEGCFDAWRRGGSFPRLFGPRVAVAFSDPISHDELMRGTPDEGLARLAARIDRTRLALRAKLRRATRGRYPPPGPGDAPLSIARASATTPAAQPHTAG